MKPSYVNHQSLAHEYMRTYNCDYDTGLNLAQRKEKGVCECCGVDLNTMKGVNEFYPDHRYNVLHVEHNHNTGEIRGIACRTCNSIIGRLENGRTVSDNNPRKTACQSWIK